MIDGEVLPLGRVGFPGGLRAGTRAGTRPPHNGVTRGDASDDVIMVMVS